MTTVWLTVAFLIFMEDKKLTTGNVVGGSGRLMLDGDHRAQVLNDNALESHRAAADKVKPPPPPPPAPPVVAAAFEDDLNNIEQRRPNPIVDNNNNNEIEDDDYESDKKDEVVAMAAPDDGKQHLPLSLSGINPESGGLYGEYGKPVTLPANMSAEMKKLVDDGWQKNAFNQYVSDLISLHRKLPDPRDEW